MQNGLEIVRVDSLNEPSVVVVRRIDGGVPGSPITVLKVMKFQFDSEHLDVTEER